MKNGFGGNFHRIPMNRKIRIRPICGGAISNSIVAELRAEACSFLPQQVNASFAVLRIVRGGWRPGLLQ